ncbi:hypothetical protein Ahy_A01g004151 [Arachis hypogaea]|uniref:Mei2-like C-terminal RNA recognition motif domain-containing protein n=1 Tax=Arachis hypogaea TaxID=3818 RepID=A0A445EUZ1_ARAHY|nr:hypothetical protein Ahy_A01g004151 [Arachis hypogaea]
MEEGCRKVTAPGTAEWAEDVKGIDDGPYNGKCNDDDYENSGRVQQNDFTAFNGKNWGKFNSKKVVSLAYARIQRKAALVTHFQNSSLMNEDKRCRPILFHSEGQETNDQENFLSSNLNICIRQPDGSYSGDLLESPKGDWDEKLEKD